MVARSRKGAGLKSKPATRKELVNLIYDLWEWNARMGYWDAPVWSRAMGVLNAEKIGGKK